MPLREMFLETALLVVDGFSASSALEGVPLDEGASVLGRVVGGPRPVAGREVGVEGDAVREPLAAYGTLEGALSSQPSGEFHFR